jgi:hypothetical protein
VKSWNILPKAVSYCVIQDWLSRVEKEADLAHIPLNFEERTGHLPQLLHAVVALLRLDADAAKLAKGN